MQRLKKLSLQENKQKKTSLESFLRNTKYRESEIKDIFNEIRFLIQQDIVLEYNNITVNSLLWINRYFYWILLVQRES